MSHSRIDYEQQFLLTYTCAKHMKLRDNNTSQQLYSFSEK
ncbi:hypothetical protein CRENPOLYSF2_2490002 [Crenothrix polyspora]|uniref:Uncharacterized protein n=2 Tax=Crenothrix polyspora TaxID=360316 RepID=A0A1R4H806_9GAMM|nr:hypothetical protein CRENPOLYSF2_2490002 [Crenothrix polyspora]SJM93127.1 hypothetical protein CRENPOLYSF1_390024 [Crenothrix polyspora]